jgi:hypothetical protein
MSVVINGSAGVTTNSGAVYDSLQRDTAKTATGTSVDFTGIPAWVRRITVMFSGVSTNGTSNILVQIGAGSVANTGYNSTASAGNTAVNSTAGFILTGIVTAATSQSGIATVTTLGSNVWVASSGLAFSNASVGNTASGNKTLSDTLDRVRITTVNGTDTFDAGTINIIYE